MSARRFVIASILAICLGAPVVEMFDQWDHTLQDGNDTEASVVVVALCIGMGLSFAGIVAARIRAMSSHSDLRTFASVPAGVTASAFGAPIPTGSPPSPLRV